MPRRIAYFTWPPREITGGIKLIFQHVEMLVEAGLNAVVVAEDGQRPGWCDSRAPVIDFVEVARDGDILVFPENHAKMLHEYEGWPNAKIVYCQNHNMVFRGLAGKTDYGDLGISGILGLGQLATDFCRQRFPGLPALQVPVFIDPERFHFQQEKTLQIAYAPRKRPMEAAFMRDWFRATYPQWRSVPWVEIHSMTEDEVMRLLKQSALYLSLQRFESVGMSALEAMACGCAVAGFTGQGGREYATTRNGFWAEEDDCIECVSQLARATELVAKGGTARNDLLESAHLTAGYYSRRRLVDRLVPFWKAFSETGQWPE